MTERGKDKKDNMPKKKTLRTYNTENILLFFPELRKNTVNS